MRTCKDCRVCCTTPSLDEVDLVKPAWTKCPNECEAGCAIYEERPQTCRDYNCLWIKGELPEWAHPNRTKLLVSRDDPSVPVINVLEAEEGAMESYYGQKLIALLGRDAVANVVRRDESNVQVSTARARKYLKQYVDEHGME